jgi:hypothetical protein
VKPIDTTIPASSKYILYLDVPYRFGARQFALSFQENEGKETSQGFGERVVHFITGALLFTPVIGHIIALAISLLCSSRTSHLSSAASNKTRAPSIDVTHAKDPYSSPEGPKSEKPASVARSVLPESPIAVSTPHPLSLDAPARQGQPATVAGRITDAVEKLERRKKGNPYFYYNRTELRSSDSPYKRFTQYHPFVAAIRSGKVEHVREFIGNPHFLGINSTFSKEVRSERCVTTWHITPLTETIQSDFFAVFQLLLTSNKLIIDTPDSNRKYTALHEACLLGKKGERYVYELIKHKADPLIESEDEETALDFARKSDMSPECLHALEAWVEKNKTDDQGNTELQQAIIKGNWARFERALQEGICLNHRNLENLDSALHLAVTLFNENEELRETAKRMFLKLLEAGAFVNIRDCHNQTPLLLLCEKRVPGWEELAYRLVKDYSADANIPSSNGIIPLAYLANLPSTRPLKKWLLENTQGKYIEFQNRFSLATLYGTTGYTHMAGQQVYLDGGNYSEAVYELLAKTYQDYRPLPEHRELFEQAKKSIEFANKLIVSNDLDALYEEARHADFPILIPSGWEGHAIAAIIDVQQQLFISANRGDRQRGTEAGIGVYKYDRFPDKETFTHLVKSFSRTTTLAKNTYLSTLKQKLGLRLIKHNQMKDQKRANCTWSSSASLGLQALFELFTAMKKNPNASENAYGQSPEVVNAMIHFNHFARWRLLTTSLEHITNNAETITCEEDSKQFREIALKCCDKIKSGKDKYGFYRKTLDAITFSGIKFSLHPTYEQREFYASLYGEKEEDFINALFPDTYQVGNWLYEIP